MSEPVIESVGLEKRFRSAATLGDLVRGRLRGRLVHALRGVELTVRRGEILALVGANGAGKSTLLRLLAGLLLPDGGRLTVLGEETTRAGPAFRRRVGFVVGDERSFSWRLSGEQNLRFFAALYGLGGREAGARIDHALGVVELAGEARRAVREYSSGMRQRLALARGLLGDPEILLFDELTRGVDPRGAATVRALIGEELRRAGRTAVVATHDLSEVTQLCTRVVALEDGRIVGDGAPADAARLLGLVPGAGAAAGRA